MNEIQLINSVRIWEKRLEIEDEKRKCNHQRFSNGSETILKRSVKESNTPYKGLFQARRKAHSFYCFNAQEDSRLTR